MHKKVWITILLLFFAALIICIAVQKKDGRKNTENSILIKEAEYAKSRI